MQKIIVTAILFVFGANLLAQPTQPFGGGLGTETEPYEIYNVWHLEELNDSIMSSEPYPSDNWSKGKYFVLMDDILYSLTAPIGFSTISGPVPLRTQLYPFQGDFDGQGFIINLAINNYIDEIYGIQPECGLFSMTSNAKISNLILDGYIYDDGFHPYTYERTGSIVGWARDTFEIYNCTSYVDIIMASLKIGAIGGIVGDCYYATGKIENCINYGNLSAGRIGGIVCHLASVSGPYEISNCINYGTLNGSNGVGGIVASAEGTGATIIDCINCGEIIDQTWTGGIAGSTYPAHILNCINIGKISKTIDERDHYTTGGIVGSIARASIISKCMNIGDVVGINNTGGIVGGSGSDNWGGPPSIIECINYGYVKGINNIGGILGDSSQNDSLTIEGCVNTGVIEGYDNVGSIVGNE
ncbi:MAG: hypothetical protein FWG85_05320 [Bacteroidetes bacterium]|nr:hypothetical protein [Bacteroidota bacterium]